MSNSVSSSAAQTTPQQTRYLLLGVGIFIAIAVVGLFYVKWSPYYGRIFVAQATGSIGGSILTGGADSLPQPSWQAALGYALSYGKSIWEALVLGLLLGSAVQTLIPRRWIARLLSDAGVGGVVAGGMLAVPSMMCTCCSSPVIRGLRGSHAGSGSTIAYWLGNTMLNPATLVFTGFVLGWNWTGLRLVMGILMVFGLGWMVRRLSLARGDNGARVSGAAASQGVDDSAGPSMFLRWLKTLVGMSVRLVPEYLVIVLLLGAARAWLFPVFDVGIDNSLWWIIALAIAGMLFVIPTAGEVPIVQAALSLGVAAGPAAALLMTLPPISLPSLAMVAKSFKPAELALVIAGVVVIGVLTGGAAVVLGF